MPTSRIHRLSPVALWIAAVLLILASPAGSTAQHASGEARKRCPQGSVAALISGERTCLRARQRCERRLDWQYHQYGFHCHDGRLSRSPAVFEKKVDVGGFRLAISCLGTGSPTVVLESGGGWGDSAWYLVQPKLATTTRVCSYDRAGLEGSDDRVPPGPETADNVVDELHRLLAAARIRPPYVLGGWSIGGFFNRLYAKRYPADVLGLVSVDGTPWGLPGEPFLQPPPFDDMANAAAELLASPGLGARPLVVLTAGVWPPDWLKWARQIALLSTSSILVRADTAGHAIQLDAPALTVEAFRQVLAAVRGGGPLPACSATSLSRLGGTCLDPESFE
jgi:pimeloyl-ACP methyl ester carboxylesterase